MMKKIYFLDTWILFLVFLAPYIAQHIENGLFVYLLLFGLALAWIYKLTLDLHKRLPAGHTLSLNKFIFHFFFASAYFLFVVVFVGSYHISTSNMDQSGRSGGLLFFLHLFSMYCIFYCFYFSAKTLSAVYYHDANPGLSSYIGSFLSFSCLPLGIWFLQPKIKKIFALNSVTTDASEKKGSR